MTIKNSFHSDDTLKFSFIVACFTGENCERHEGRGNLHVFLRFELADRHFALLLISTQRSYFHSTDTQDHFSFIVAGAAGNKCCFYHNGICRARQTSKNPGSRPGFWALAKAYLHVWYSGSIQLLYLGQVLQTCLQFLTGEFNILGLSGQVAVIGTQVQVSVAA